MSKSCCFALVLAAICLSLEADAQPTVDETMTCSSSTLEEVVNMVTVIASNQKENAKKTRDEIRDVKTLLVSGSGETNETRLEDVVKEIEDMKTLLVSGNGETNETRLEDVVKEIKGEIKDEIKDVKTLLVSGSGETNETTLEDVVKEIKDVKTHLVSGSGETNETRLEYVVKEIKDVKKLLTSNPTDCVTTEPSKQALVSALVCEYLVCFQFDNIGLTQITHTMLL